MICEIICIDGFLCMSHMDIVHILSAYVHVIHILSEYMHIIHTLFAVVLNMFLPNRQCRCYPYIISSTLYISYHVEFSFRTLSTQTHIVNAICMLSTDAYLMYISFLLLLFAYVSLQLCVQNAVSTQPCVGKLRISLVLLNFLGCNFRLWFKTP